MTKISIRDGYGYTDDEYNDEVDIYDGYTYEEYADIVMPEHECYDTDDGTTCARNIRRLV